MKMIAASLSTVFGIIAALLVFTPYFKTPPLAIVIFAILGMIAGLMSIKEVKGLSTAGIILSVISFAYLIYLYIQLGG